jgi:hypothetical protein
MAPHGSIVVTYTFQIELTTISDYDLIVIVAGAMTGSQPVTSRQLDL